MLRTGLALVAFAALAPAACGAEYKPGFSANVPVTAPTRLDWTFAATDRTLESPPPDLLEKGYDSTKQAFDLYLPPRKGPKRPIAAVVFVSAGNDAAGWKSFEPACTKLGMAFVAVRGAGNGTPGPKRGRVVLDCLDEVRRRVPLDPDRTYLAGFSGGGRTACSIAFALPEHFGGVLPLCAGGDLRGEPWLRHRAADRLSAALVSGQSDFNRGEVERWKGPSWQGLGLRSRVWVQPSLGHAVPNAATLGEALAWLEEDRPRRAALAKKWPASRAGTQGALSSEEFAAALAAEAKEKLADAATTYAGLMLLKGVSQRWPDLDAGRAAREALLDYEARKERPWEADDIAEQRRALVAEARGLGDYALNGVPAGSPYLKYRPDMAKKAVALWTRVIEDSPKSEAAAEGRKRLTELAALAGK